jgi:plastocyanin
MYSTAVLSILALPFLAAAQYDYGGGGGSSQTSAAPASAPSAPADTDTQKNVCFPLRPPSHLLTLGKINVGFNGAFVYNPTNITAKKGTLVTFWYASST